MEDKNSNEIQILSALFAGVAVGMIIGAALMGFMILWL